MKNVNMWWKVLKNTGLSWMEDKVPRLAAALAFYTILSAAPLLVIFLSIAGLVFHRDQEVRKLVVDQFTNLVGEQGGQAIHIMIDHVSRPGSSIPAMVVGIILLLVGASGVFAELQDSLNTIWEVTPKPGRGLWGTISDRFLSLLMVLGTGFLLLVNLIISTAMAAITNFTMRMEYGDTEYQVALSEVGPESERDLLNVRIIR